MNSKNSSSFTVEIVRALADVEGVEEPSELDYKIYDFTDPDALEMLHGKEDSTWEMELEISGHEVYLSSEGTINIDGNKYFYEQ